MSSSTIRIPQLIRKNKNDDALIFNNNDGGVVVVTHPQRAPSISRQSPQLQSHRSSPYYHPVAQRQFRNIRSLTYIDDSSYKILIQRPSHDYWYNRNNNNNNIYDDTTAFGRSMPTKRHSSCCVVSSRIRPLQDGQRPQYSVNNHHHHHHHHHHHCKRPYSTTTSVSTGSGKRKNYKQPHNKASDLPATMKTTTTTTTEPSTSTSSSQQLPFTIAARPAGEKISVDDSRFKLPDREKENELSRLQIQIQDLYKAGKYARALNLSEKLVQDTIVHLGAHHPATAAAYNNLGLMRKLQGQFDESRGDYLKAQDIYREVVGSDHGSYANVLHNLGNLNRTQIHLDTSLSATDRLSLVESALRYLEDAYNIRVAELGRDHPHTVSSRSGWGATLAAQILHHHRMTRVAAQSGDLLRKKFYLSILPADVTEAAWIAAEEHLRDAFTTAIDKPRGMTIEKATTHNNTNAAPNRGKRKIKSKIDDGSTTKNALKTPQTLSAASAAQNLAVFLKARATTVEPYNMNWLQEAEKLYRQALHVQTILLLPKVANITNNKTSSSTRSSSETDTSSDGGSGSNTYTPRSSTSGESTTTTASKKGNQLHPDMYATKHSLAEVLDAMGRTEDANTMRQEILDTFDPSTIESVVAEENNEVPSPSSGVATAAAGSNISNVESEFIPDADFDEHDDDNDNDNELSNHDDDDDDDDNDSHHHAVTNDSGVRDDDNDDINNNNDDDDNVLKNKPIKDLP